MEEVNTEVGRFTVDTVHPEKDLIRLTVYTTKNFMPVDIDFTLTADEAGAIGESLLHLAIKNGYELTSE